MVRNVRIPKRIGAIKVSKKIRKRVRKAVESAASPFVRDFATAAMAAAGRARRAEYGGDKEERMVRVVCGETKVHIEGSKVAEAFRAAAVDGFRRFLEGFEEGLRRAQAEANVEPEAAKPAARPKKAKAAAKPRAARPARKPRATGRAGAPGAAKS